MNAYARRKVEELARLDLSGYILKKDSPSCGMERVRVYDENDVPAKTGRGLFATVLLEPMPHLPVEEEGRLQDPRLRENFVERVFACRRLRDFFTSPWKMGDLVRFHTAEKFLLLAHDAAAYEKLGRLVAGVIEDYRRGLVPLIVPLTLIRHYVRVHHVAYLEGQYYLEPHPKELMLRNHV